MSINKASSMAIYQLPRCHKTFTHLIAHTIKYAYGLLWLCLGYANCPRRLRWGFYWEKLVKVTSLAHSASVVTLGVSTSNQWASYQIRKIAGCACAGNAGNVFPATDFKGNRKLAISACITARASRTSPDACRDRFYAVVGKTFPAFPAHAQLAILRIWQEAHGEWSYLNQWLSGPINLKLIGSASLARSIRIRFHFRHRIGRIRSISDHRAGRVLRSRHRPKTPNCLPGARDQVPALFRNAIEQRGASVDPNSGAWKYIWYVATHGQSVITTELMIA